VGDWVARLVGEMAMVAAVATQAERIDLDRPCCGEIPCFACQAEIRAEADACLHELSESYTMDASVHWLR
jgi:hypothetical protein